MSDFEDRLRDSLARHAADAPAGQLLAERIVRTAETAPQRSRGWRVWAFPLIAAGAVGAVVAAMAGIENYHPSAAPPARSPSVVRPAPSHATSSAPHAANTAPADTSTLHNVRILDLTFVGPDDGWALASADCVRGAGRCTAFLRTANGTTWRSMPGPAFNVADVRGCADPCVQHLRFANDSIGYAFGPSALLMTTDGGAHWQRQPGGAIALETLDENVIRVTTACLPGCPYRVQTASVGAVAWHSTATVAGGMSPGISLTRVGGDAYLAVFGHTAGGAARATSALWASTDGGAHWTDRGEPCPQLNAEYDSTEIATAADGSVSLLCTPREQPVGWQFTVTSSDGGGHFVAGNEKALGGARVSAFAAASSRVLLASSDVTYRSTDGGQHFARTSLGPVGWLGFESAKVGRAVTDNRTIWTTRDGGKTWIPTRLS